jgi:PhzF family phenazine biosynthesis protein
MRLRIFQVDAFASALFRGNPAAIVPSPYPLSEELMQKIAMENNLSETAFIVRQNGGDGDGRYAIRWFTPALEVDLCGHATLGAAWVILNELEPGLLGVTFETKGAGLLTVRRDEGDPERLVMDLPSRPPAPFVGDSGALGAALGAPPLEIHKSRDLIAVFRSERDVRALKPDFRALAAVSTFACVATAPGDAADFVSRFFGPAVGVDEDPVTGSAHCELVPFWAQRLSKSRLRALQVSARGGEIFCELKRDRVEMGGRVAPYLTGEIVV